MSTILMDRPDQTLGLVRFRLRQEKWLSQIIWSQCIVSGLTISWGFPLFQVTWVGPATGRKSWPKLPHTDLIFPGELGRSGWLVGVAMNRCT